jgi:hypothetical protein
MSNISVNTITDASGGSTASINGLTPQASNMQPFNRIINGAMTISQRGSPTMTGGGDYSVDRFGNFYSGNAYTSAQSTTAPTGFANSLLLTTTTPSASPVYSIIYHKVEGLNCADLGFGTATASTVTLSFWVRASVTGVYSLAIGNDNADRAYAVQYSINVANTWEQKTMTVAGDTTGTWLTTNGTGIFLRWNMGTSSAGRLISAGSWQAVNADGATGSTGANTWANTSGATFYITGVQLEAGSTASSFAHENYGDTLQKCQRYYYKYVANSGSSGFFAGYASASTLADGIVSFPVTMRAAPAALETSGTATDYRVRALGTNAICTSVPTFFIADVGSSHIRFTTSGVLTGGSGIIAASNTGAAPDVAYLAWSAEL